MKKYIVVKEVNGVINSVFAAYPDKDKAKKIAATLDEMSRAYEIMSDTITNITYSVYEQI